MSKAGEIKKLSKLVMPDIAIITNIAEAHIENFKNLSGIAKAKGEIIQNIKKNGTLVLNRDDVFFSRVCLRSANLFFVFRGFHRVLRVRSRAGRSECFEVV